jgi:hypothetical protein
VLCDSWAQSVIIQGKLHGVTAAELVHPDDTYDPSQGYGHKHPFVRILHACGAYSTIRFKTVNQRTKSLASPRSRASSLMSRCRMCAFTPRPCQAHRARRLDERLYDAYQRAGRVVSRAGRGRGLTVGTAPPDLTRA